MTYTEAEQYLLSLSHLPRREYMNDTRRTGSYLKRLQFLLDILGNPERKIPHYIHVTGTSGKGSVSSFIAAILTADGKKTGLYISPHPTRLTERWSIGGQPMPEAEFVRSIERLKPALDRYLATSPYDMVSFFDLVTAIAFMYFAEKKVTWAVMEVGCGGRYDSTNVLPHKDAAVITSIGLDHTELLGRTKTKIAYEKAGIIKPGTRVFLGPVSRPVFNVIQTEALKAGVETVVKSPLSPIKVTAKNEDGITFTYGTKRYALRSLGEHQAYNAALAIDLTRALEISEKAIAMGLKKTVQPLRFEIVRKKPIIVLDGAHNPDKIASTVRTALQLKNARPDRNVHLVLGFSADKNLAGMIKKLAELKPRSVACTHNTVNPFRKAADPKHIARTVKRYAPSAACELFLDPKAAYSWARRHAKSDDILIVTGSIFLSGELRPGLTKRV